MSSLSFQGDARLQVAIAILYQRQPEQSLRFLMQLRDDIPGIAYPGHWGFFGGHLESGESPCAALKRELTEEIGYTPPAIAKFKTVESPSSIRHVYTVPLRVSLGSLSLNEGWDMALFTPEEIWKGERFSQAAQQVRPIGEPHQNILKEFMAEGDRPMMPFS